MTGFTCLGEGRVFLIAFLSYISKVPLKYMEIMKMEKIDGLGLEKSPSPFIV